MTNEKLDMWVKQLGEAWVNLDTDSALNLVDKEDITWLESPFVKPLESWQAVYEQWEKDLKDQKNVQFSHEVLACDYNQGVVRWKATITKISNGKTINMDGIFLISLNDKNLCTKFTMWTESKVQI